jgi:hypothetical protein
LTANPISLGLNANKVAFLPLHCNKSRRLWPCPESICVQRNQKWGNKAKIVAVADSTTIEMADGHTITFSGSGVNDPLAAIPLIEEVFGTVK